MITENLSTLEIHKLTQEQYDRELAAGNINDTALYLTPEEEGVSKEEFNAFKDSLIIDNLTSTDTTKALSANQGRELDKKIAAINTNIGNLGGGDMMKSVYDIDNNGVVDTADSANKLNSDAGDSTHPVYFKNGIPVATDYTIESNVPANAIFTDTTYDLATAAENGLMSKEDKAFMSQMTEEGILVLQAGDSYGNITFAPPKNNLEATGYAVIPAENGLYIYPTNNTSKQIFINFADNTIFANNYTFTGMATKAAQDADGNVISDTYAKKAELPGEENVTLDQLGILVSAEEINFLDSAKSNIQGQLDSALNSINGKSSVSISNNLTSGEKIATISIDGTETDLYAPEGGGNGDSYTLPIATAAELGGVKSGGDITVESDGTMTVSNNSHEHTVSNISDFPSSLKNPKKLFISVGDLEIEEYDGSKELIVAIDKSTIGAAPENHTHNYNSLTNKPLIEDDSSDSFNIVDEDGNAIFSIGDYGVATTNIHLNDVNVLDTFVKIQEQLDNKLPISGGTIVQEVPLQYDPNEEFEGDDTPLSLQSVNDYYSFLGFYNEKGKFLGKIGFKDGNVRPCIVGNDNKSYDLIHSGNIENILPTFTSADEGKVLGIKDGELAWVTATGGTSAAMPDAEGMVF